MTASPDSAISEGEIRESGSEKATRMQHSSHDNNVNPLSRPYRPLTRSPSPYRDPRVNTFRSRSRSPYRESRGTKRPRGEHYQNRSQDSPARRLKFHHEKVSTDPRRRRYEDDRNTNSTRGGIRLSREDPPAYQPRYPGPRGLSGSPEPYRHPEGISNSKSRTRRDLLSDNSSVRSSGARGNTKDHGRVPEVQTVSDRGKSSFVPKSSIQEAKPNGDQKRLLCDPSDSLLAPATHYVRNTSATFRQPAYSNHEGGTDVEIKSLSKTLDEAALIEERRKRREAIKAKHQAQEAPVTEIKAAEYVDDIRPPRPTENQPTANSEDSRPLIAKEPNREESPALINLAKDLDISVDIAREDGTMDEDGPSAADYDPTNDMREDRVRHDQHLHEIDVPAALYDERRFTDQDVLLPKRKDDALHPIIMGGSKTDGDFDMFGDDEDADMFAEPCAQKTDHVMDSAKVVEVPKAKSLNMSTLDDRDDHEGYYKVILGEILDNRYQVQSNLGKGMFSGVVRATDMSTQRMVAIKIIRSNETMRKAGAKEMDILQRLAALDPEDKKHLVRLEGSFEHKGHLCMVFENLSINLREVLKKFGRDVGINLKAVRAYAQQIFLGLSLLRRCNILHADLKPDNILVNESRNLLKICDLGSASDASENEIAQYLVSRYYRAPEIILGLPYDFAIDIWSVGCTLFELFTGKILFTGRSNNQMLRAIMETRGKFSHKLLRRAHFAPIHFDDLLNFRSVERERITGKDVVRVVNVSKPLRDLKSRVMAGKSSLGSGDEKDLTLFADLLDKCLNLNPEKRCTPTEALKHPFFAKGK